jgi:ATP-dependent protease ClpP protease subunit
MSEFDQHPPGPFAIPTVIEQNGRGEHSYDIERRLQLMLKTNARLIRLLAYHTRQTEQQIRKDSDRDFWMSAEEAQKYGIVDKVVGFRQDGL